MPAETASRLEQLVSRLATFGIKSSKIGKSCQKTASMLARVGRKKRNIFYGLLYPLRQLPKHSSKFATAAKQVLG
jgi:hypothetical protein